MTIATVTGSAVLSYADLSKIADVPITYAKDGRLQLRYTRDVFGRELSFAVSALPRLDVEAQVVRLTDPKLDLGGNTVDLGLTPGPAGLDRRADHGRSSITACA